MFQMLGHATAIVALCVSRARNMEYPGLRGADPIPEWVCYRNNSKLCAAILTKLGL